jgi:hypothetical protein
MPLAIATGGVLLRRRADHCLEQWRTNGTQDRHPALASDLGIPQALFAA